MSIETDVMLRTGNAKIMKERAKNSTKYKTRGVRGVPNFMTDEQVRAHTEAEALNKQSDKSGIGVTELRAIQRITRISYKDIRSKYRFSELMWVRSILCQHYRRRGYTFRAIGKMLNRQEHTIMHLYKMHDVYYDSVVIYAHWYKQFVAETDELK